MDTDCLFCKLVRGDLPSHRIYEDVDFVVLLTIYPVNPGHVMVVTKEHIASFYDVEDALYTPLMLVVKRMALVVKRVIAPLQVVMETSGITNHHVHVHVLPVHSLYDRTPQDVMERLLAQLAPAEELAAMARDLATGMK